MYFVKLALLLAIIGGTSSKNMNDHSGALSNASHIEDSFIDDGKQSYESTLKSYEPQLRALEVDSDIGTQRRCQSHMLIVGGDDRYESFASTIVSNDGDHILL
jgi:hypothetical protein